MLLIASLLTNSWAAAQTGDWKLVSVTQETSAAQAQPAAGTIAYEVRLEELERWALTEQGRVSPLRENKDTGGLMLVEARFRVSVPSLRWIDELRLDASFLDHINRKTKFQAVAGQKDLFQGRSRQFLFDVTFQAEARHLKGEALAAELRARGHGDLVALGAQAAVLQEFRNYNRFLQGGESLLLFVPLGNHETLVIVRSVSATSKSVPGVIRGAMQGDIGNKLQHLAAQLSHVFRP